MVFSLSILAGEFRGGGGNINKFFMICLTSKKDIVKLRIEGRRPPKTSANDNGIELAFGRAFFYFLTNRIRLFFIHFAQLSLRKRQELHTFDLKKI